MAENSKIEWCDHTGNIWWGCVAVHAGCDNCYAETLSHRWGNDIWGADKPRKITKNFFLDMGRYQEMAKKAGTIHKVFVGSMMDIFEKPMPVINWKGESLPFNTGFYRDTFFRYVSEGMYPNLLFLLLTKRPSNINKYIPESWKTDPPKNVMFGTSPCDQATFNTLVPQLMQVNGKRFLSLEPMLGPVDIKKDFPVGKGEVQYGLLLDWIICGGESGPGKRPMGIDWARKLRDDCQQASVPFFMKQIDKVQPIPEDLMIREFPII